MIKIVTVSGSPVEDSSTDRMLAKLAEEVKVGVGTAHECAIHEIKIRDLKFIPCQACGKAPDDSFCFFDDGLTDVYDVVAECDCLLFGSPVYFDSVSAQAKAFIDRCNCFRPADFNDINPAHSFIKRLKTKRPGAIILVGGENGWFEGARRCIAGFFKWIEVVNEGQVFFRTPDFNTRGTALDHIGTREDISHLAGHLATQLLACHAK